MWSSILLSKMILFVSIFHLYLATEKKPEYIGSECHAASVLHVNKDHEVFNSFFSQNHCVSWEWGTFTKEVVNTTVFDYPDKSPCPTYKNGEFHRGKWKIEACRIAWLESHELRKSLVGKRLAFVGDSLSRQIYLRLIWHIRGLTEIMEHFFHTNSSYAFNGTHDYFSIGKAYVEGEEKLSSFELQNTQFVAVFIWNPNMQDITFSLNQYDAIIMVYSYWVNDKDFIFKAKKFQNIQNVLYATAPATRAATNTRGRFVPGATHTLRNDWIKNLNTTFLPLAEMGGTNVFIQNTEDGIHFQCAFLQKYPEQVKYVFKTPPSGDCRDLLNLNAVQIIIHWIYTRHL